MDNLDAQIAPVQTQLTTALKQGEPQDSPQILQMDARLERMRRLWATHRRIRLETEKSEGRHAGRIN